MMRTVVFFFVLLFVFPSFTKAKNTYYFSDTSKSSLHILDSIGKKPLQKNYYKISKGEFIQRYAFDENTNKIITYYFDKLQETKTEKRYVLFLYLTTLIPISLLGAFLFLHFLGIIYASLFIIVLVLNIILFINNLISLKQMEIIFSKEKLLKSLITYRKTGNFPEAIKKYKKKEKHNRTDDIE